VSKTKTVTLKLIYLNYVKEARARRYKNKMLCMLNPSRSTRNPAHLYRKAGRKKPNQGYTWRNIILVMILLLIGGGLISYIDNPEKVSVQVKDALPFLAPKYELRIYAPSEVSWTLYGPMETSKGTIIIMETHRGNYRLTDISDIKRISVSLLILHIGSDYRIELVKGDEIIASGHDTLIWEKPN